MLDYNKCKDSSPQNTVQKIQSILSEMGLTTQVEWVHSEYENALSNRVTLCPTSLGTNGKGTDQAYALASGYAELIERMENAILMMGYTSPSLLAASGFSYSPDEHILSAEELAKQEDPFTQFLFAHYRANTFEEKVSCLEKLPRPGEKFLCAPFADPNGSRVVWLPAEVIFPIYGSNGMAAGNTLEEALVQALSEILERYSNKAVLDGVIPPEVPRAYWEKTQISTLIHKIEASGRYRVSLRDCSLGKQIPAIAIVISDLENGCFGIHFSCHPSLEVSIERSLTEALQGKNLEEFTRFNSIGNAQMCHCVDNYPNLMKIGYGTYPICFFAGEPSYEFSPFDSWNGLTNSQMLQKLLKIIYDEGFQVLVRDASHLNFPAYQVLVPGMSEMFFAGGNRIREIRTFNRVAESMKHFPDLTQEEEDRLLLLLRYKEFSSLENSISWITTLPIIGQKVTTEKVRACLHCKRREYEEAYRWFTAAAEESPEEQLMLLCCAEYSRLLLMGTDPDMAERALRNYFPATIAEEVSEKLREPDLILKKMFLPFFCDNCTNCPHAGITCEYPEIEKVMRKVKAGLARSTVTQESLLQRLSELMHQTI